MGNPYGLMMTNTNNQTNAARFTGNIYAEAEIIHNLKFRTVVGYEYYSSDFRSFTPLYHFSAYSQNINQTRVSQSASHNQQITWTNTLSYDWKIKDRSFCRQICQHLFLSFITIQFASTLSFQEEQMYLTVII